MIQKMKIESHKRKKTELVDVRLKWVSHVMEIAHVQESMGNAYLLAHVNKEESVPVTLTKLL